MQVADGCSDEHKMVRFTSSITRTLSLLLLIVHVVGQLHRHCQTNIHYGWKACRIPTNPSTGCSEHEKIWNVTELPTTALAVLLENQQIVGVEHLHMENLYFSTNMQLIPDISDVGAEYFTLLYEIELPALLENSICHNSIFKIQSTRQTLRVAGVNYRAKAWLNGKQLLELSSLYSRRDSTPGMFLRRSYDVTTGGRFNLLIAPPDHPGTPNGGQGGE